MKHISKFGKVICLIILGIFLLISPIALPAIYMVLTNPACESSSKDFLSSDNHNVASIITEECPAMAGDSVYVFTGLKIALSSSKPDKIFSQVDTAPDLLWLNDKTLLVIIKNASDIETAASSWHDVTIHYELANNLVEAEKSFRVSEPSKGRVPSGYGLYPEQYMKLSSAPTPEQYEKFRNWAQGHVENWPK